PRAFQRDPHPGAATAPNSDFITPAADVGVAKVGTPDPAARGGIVTYHVRATNHGPTTATDVVVRDALPEGARLVPAPTFRSGSVPCRIARIAARRSVTFDLVARLGSSTRNRISIRARQADPAGANGGDRSSAALAPRLRLTHKVSR